MRSSDVSIGVKGNTAGLQASFKQAADEAERESGITAAHREVYQGRNFNIHLNQG